MPQRAEAKERGGSPDLVSGPYAVNLRIPNSGGQPEWRGRFILGGGENTKEQIKESMKEINALPDGLGPDQLRQEAGRIFSSKGLLRVDF